MLRFERALTRMYYFLPLNQTIDVTI